MRWGSAGEIWLESGEVLLSPSSDTTVQAGEHTVSIAGGSMALVRNDDRVVTVRTLLEHRSQSVKAYIDGKHWLNVPAGEEVLIADNSQPTSGDSVGRRRIRNHTVPSGREVVRSEISFTSLVNDSDILSNIAQSTDDENRAAFNRLVKMAACLHMVTAGHGAYGSKR